VLRAPVTSTYERKRPPPDPTSQSVGASFGRVLLALEYRGSPDPLWSSGFVQGSCLVGGWSEKAAQAATGNRKGAAAHSRIPSGERVAGQQGQKAPCKESFPDPVQRRFRQPGELIGPQRVSHGRG
jgi:hypothetical protein